MKKIFFFTGSLFALLWVFFLNSKKVPHTEALDIAQLVVVRESKDARIERIDQQIEDLEEMKRGYEARALRHEDQAERLQFNDQAVLEVRRHYELAEENRQKAAAVQKEIDRLKEERSKLLTLN